MLAFVLGGGGSRGALQVGALRALLEAGIQPDMLIGTSVGATNAAFIAADPTTAGLDRLQDVWLEMGDEPIFPGNIGLALLRFVRGRASLYPNDTMHQLLTRYLPVERFDELALPCYAIAMDLDNGEIVAFGDDESDRLVDGLMSSMALIPAHPPWEVGERRYVDGGFGAVLPVRHAIRRGATEIIAMNLSTKLPEPETVQSAYEIMLQTSDLMIRRQTKIDLIEAAKHVKLTVLDLQSDVDVSIDDFSYTEERIARGREIAQGMLASMA